MRYTYGYQNQLLHRTSCVAGDSKSLPKKTSAELWGLACMNGVAWMAVTGVMKHMSGGG